MGLEVDGVNINSVEIDGVKVNEFTMEGNTFLAPPTITTQPSDGAVKDNQTFNLSVVAQSLGGDYKYQWYKNGSAIAGATAANYTHPTSPAASYKYKVEVTNGMGSVMSREATVIVTVSWAKTHTVTVQYTTIQGVGQWGFLSGTMGAISPTTFAGAAIKGCNCNSTNDVSFQLAGNHEGRYITIEYGEAGRKLRIRGSYLSFNNTTYFNANNATVSSYIKSLNGSTMNIRVYWS